MAEQRRKDTGRRVLPAAFDTADAERRWTEAWAARGTYHYDASRPRELTFAIDTPPPTVSGYLHIGHAFSYAQTDFVARYQRMRGKNVFYPMGWDDNGLPTERRVQNYFNVRCDPTLPYEPGLTASMAPADGKAHAHSARHVSRENFIELCHRVTVQDEDAFKRLWTRLGLSVDWRQEYATIDDHSRRIAQLSFFDLLQKGHIYHTTAPMMWDTVFRTAVAQAEVEDRVVPGAMYRLAFGIEGSDEVVHVATTRPELVPACVGLTAHPEDSRYSHLFGSRAVTPLLGIPVPIFASDRVDREKGTGAVMVCTFGDATDVQWWQEQRLATRLAVGRDGRLQPLSFAESLRPDGAANYEHFIGLHTKKARARMVERLREPGSGPRGDGTPGLVGEPEPLEHAVKFYEKGDEPLEFIPTRQWFVRLLDRKDAFLKQGERLRWTPEFMGGRYRSWVENLQFDWCISRQRYFGVAIPVWYPLDEQGNPDHATVLRPDPATLPIDPMSETPPGYSPDQRGQANGFIGDPDVFDTWFTSSVSPQVNTGWLLNPERHARLFPFDIRPQAHDIIRTWTFYTVVKSLLHENRLPWSDVLVSGWVLDPHRKKMSKSVGNVVTPSQWIEKYGADAVRYWSGSARLGVDTSFDENVLKVGRRLVTKIFNAAKFVYQQEAAPGVPTEELDLGLLHRLSELVERATAAHERFDYSFGLSETESFFWNAFTDNYIELSKDRLRGGGQRAASATGSLHLGLSVMLRLFAPVLPYITEEVWSWRLAGETSVDSIHRAPWPSQADFAGIEPPRNAASFAVALSAIAAVRKYKSSQEVSMMAPLAQLEFRVHPEAEAALRVVLRDVVATARAHDATVLADETLARGEVGVEARLLAR